MQDFRLEAETHALQQAPREACGVVVNGQYWRCRNIAEDPEQDFVIEPRDYAMAAMYGEVEAIVHSHPMGGPASFVDKYSCTATKLPWHIWSVPDKQWFIINPS